MKLKRYLFSLNLPFYGAIIPAQQYMSLDIITFIGNMVRNPSLIPEDFKNNHLIQINADMLHRLNSIPSKALQNAGEVKDFSSQYRNKTTFKCFVCNFKITVC